VVKNDFSGFHLVSEPDIDFIEQFGKLS